MKKIPDIFKTKDKTFSIELFPPKTEQGYKNLLETISQFSQLDLDFISCTYGAGGGNRDKTLDITQYIQDKHQITSLAHLTCVLNTKNEIKQILDEIVTRGIKNVLALRGDPPQDNPNWTPTNDNFQYSKDLCAFIKENYGEKIGIGVAGFPEGHILCKDKDIDAQYCKMKIDNGADFIITQLFFDNQYYFEYTNRLKNLGVSVRIIPGILPITNYEGLLKFTATCGTSITPEVKRIFEPIKDDKNATLREGINFAIKQCKELLDGGAPGIHFYSLNKIHPTKEILKEIKSI